MSRVVLAVLFIALPACLVGQEKAKPARPDPTVADYAYGTQSERQKLDFWQAGSDKPTPVVVLIHGGGWSNGDKTSYGSFAIRTYREAGISVAAINYRLISQAMEQKVEPPVKACLYDAARAVQTLRAKSKEWNIDPDRVGANGGSAGACTCLWLALHDDLADPKSEDPVARESSRPTCVAVGSAQTSLDPQEVKKWIPNAFYGGHAFGFANKKTKRGESFALALANRQRIMPWIKEYSPIELVTKDDPPIYLAYPQQEKEPKFGEEQPDPTHSALYGIKLYEKLEATGVEAVLTYPGREEEKYGSMAKFLIAKLQRE
jgi:acetyl esterase/lipase